MIIEIHMRKYHVAMILNFPFLEETFKYHLNTFLCNVTFSDFFNDIKLSISPEDICRNVSNTNYTIIVSHFFDI
jgi:hypothetical protein